MQHKHSLPKAGFTLVEMAIVLLIIALLAGGVFAGRDFIRTAQLQSIVGDVAKYKQAVTDFRDKYQAIPGDFAGATALWGAMQNCPPGADARYPSTDTPRAVTCNGSGDGRVNPSPYTAGSTGESESLLFWQHLSLAGMITGQFSGVGPSNDNAVHKVSKNCPSTRLANVGFSIKDYGAVATADTNFFAGVYNGTFMLGTVATSTTHGPGISTQDSYWLDLKMDDGFPGSGNVLGMEPGGAIAPNCATTTDPTTSQYNTTYTSQPACALLFPRII